ncbi:glycoside hydrolase family 104 protein [Campylobacter sp. W0014]|uniref:glycoside hydrolase family 24 protein n=1 Tax=Campylobacter sp. W0014 TaxID=2735781 RepID=UPI00301E161F
MEFEKISFEKYNKIKTSLLISVEGLKTEVYRDNQGIATIGIGINIGQKSLKGIWIKLILYYLFGLIKDLKDIPYTRFDSDITLKEIIKDTKSYKYKEYETLIQGISNNIFKTLETDIRTSTLNKIIKDAIENYCKETEQKQRSNPKTSLEELQRLSDEDLKINKDKPNKYLEFELSEEQAEELFEIISINYELDTLHYFKKKNILFFHKNKNKKEDKKEYYQEFIPFVSATYQGGNFIMQNKLLEKAFNIYKSRFFIWVIIRYFIGKDARRMILQSCIFNFNGKLKKEEESDEEKLDTCIDIFKVLNLIHPTEKQTYFSYFKTMEQHMLKQIKAVKTEYDNKNVDISGYKVYNYVNPNELQALVSILKPYVEYFNDEKFIGKAKFETESDFKKYKEKESDKEYRFKAENIYVMDNSNYNEVLRALREYKNTQETKENILVFIIEKINMEIKIDQPSNTYLYIKSVKGNCFDCSCINNPFKENTKQNDKAELFLYERLSNDKTKTTSLATKELEMKEKETNDQELIANYNGINYCFDILNQLKIEKDDELLFTLSNYCHYLENRENSHILKTDLKPDKTYSTLGIELKVPKTQDTFCNNGNFTININDIDLQKIQNYTNNTITEGTPIYIYVQESQQNYVCKLEDKALSRNIYLDRTLEKDEQGNLKLINTKNIFIGFKAFSSIAMANNTFSQKLQICVEDLNKGDKTVKFNTPYCYLIEDKVYEEWREEKERKEIDIKIARLKAFMYALRYGEGTLGQKGYKIIVGGGMFNDFSKHPNIYIKKLDSTAAGAYQFLFTTWNDIVLKYGKKYDISDFSPKNQDKACIILLYKYKEATDLIMSNKIEEAVKSRKDNPRKRLYYTWASLPDSPYDQRTETMENFMTYYNKHLEEELQGISNLAISNQEIAKLLQLLGG